MKSLFIKTNNSKSITYLLNELESLNIKNTYFSCKNFKHYTNIIVHYLGDDLNYFYNELSNILSYLIIDNFEEETIKKIILNNYFYFDSSEIKYILEICEDILSNSSDFSIQSRYDLLFNIFYEHISSEKKLYLNGFFPFKTKNYLKYLENIVDIAVNKYIIEREYLEFISLLKIYINSHASNIEFVSLYYDTSNPKLFDKDNNVIDIKDDLFDLKYLSDISFSSNDYVLNALLTLIPKKIVIHLAGASMDDFINTLSLIFENRVTICK